MSLKLSVVCLCSAVLSAQSLSFDLATVPTTAPPQSVVTGDFNGEGKPVLTRISATHELYRRNVGSQRFSRHLRLSDDG
jgi:hypothetical protein